MRFLGLKFAFICVWVASFAAVSYAQDTVMEIAVEGNRYVETAAVLIKVHSQVGQDLNRGVISKDLRRLFATGYFSDVYTEGERVDGGIKLIFVVKENPVVASVSMQGNEEISTKKLKPKLKIKPGFILSPRAEQADINTIRKAYLKKGFYQVDVQMKTTLLEDGRVDISVNVDEGAVTYIKEIRFIGNQAFTDEVLRGALASRASDLGSWFSSRDVFNKSRFEADAQMLRIFYQDAGYLDARIESTRLMLSPDKNSFYLALSIHEGPEFTVSGIEITGDIVPSKEVLDDEVTLEVGELYSLKELRKSIEGLTERVGDEGFAFASVTPIFRRDIEKNEVSVAFDIEKGREIYIERIEITGHEKTQEHVIRRELRQHEAERYSASNIRRSKERLRRLSYLKDVRISTPRGSSVNTANMKLDVEEGKSGSFSAGVTYSQLYALSLTGSVKENNLFGEGYQTSISADVGGATNNYAVSLTDPYLFGEDVSGSVRLFRTETDLRTFVLYNQKSQGGSVNLGLALDEYMRYSVGYSVASTTLTGVPVTSSFALRSQEGTNVTGEFTQSLSYDTRNTVVAPTDGGIHTVSLGYAGITGSDKFYEWNAKTINYFPLNDRWTLRGTLRAGAIQGYNGLEAPIYRRYSLGGVGSVRGYDYYGITITDPATLDVLGGTSKAMASLDLIFPMPYMESAGFRGAFFIDTGTVWGTSGLVSEGFDASKIRGAYGFGIAWSSPIGPITMAWSTAVNVQAFDVTRTFEFALGRGF